MTFPNVDAMYKEAGNACAGELVCHGCGRRERVDGAKGSRYLRSGWPKCCGQTMRLISAAERARMDDELARGLVATVVNVAVLLKLEVAYIGKSKRPHMARSRSQKGITICGKRIPPGARPEHFDTATDLCANCRHVLRAHVESEWGT